MMAVSQGNYAGSAAVSISGWVVTLSLDPGLAQAAIDALRRHQAIEMGEVAGHRAPVVVETDDRDETSAVWEWLHSLPGVLFVDVAFLHFDEDAVPVNTEEA
jgi:hypothetical protein